MLDIVILSLPKLSVIVSESEICLVQAVFLRSEGISPPLPVVPLLVMPLSQDTNAKPNTSATGSITEINLNLKRINRFMLILYHDLGVFSSFSSVVIYSPI